MCGSQFRSEPDSAFPMASRAAPRNALSGGIPQKGSAPDLSSSCRGPASPHVPASRSSHVRHPPFLFKLALLAQPVLPSLRAMSSGSQMGAQAHAGSERDPLLGAAYGIGGVFASAVRLLLPLPIRVL